MFKRKMVKRNDNKTVFKVFILLMSILAFRYSQASKETFINVSKNNMENIRIKFTVNGKECFATLYDNPAAKSFAAQLPVVIALEDYARTEVIFYPEKKLSTSGMPEGYKPAAGDITYYAPWGDVAIFYKDFGYASGLFSLGRIEGDGIDVLKSAVNQKVTITIVK